ncbi:unnamed protein product, partial [Mesorhabditis spiculigera]
MPILSSTSQFFTLPFRRKKQRYTINPPDEQYNVIYLGNVLTVMAKGDNCVEKPLSLIWRAYCQRQRTDLHMQLEITRSGLKAETSQQGLTEYWAHRITHCSAPAEYPKVFCWIYKHDGKRLKPELRCHAVLCKKAAEPALISMRLNEFLKAALEEYKREKLAQQNARLSSSTGCPRRKLMLQTGSLNFRPPVSRSKSAPRLGSIDEEIEEEDQSDNESFCYREEPIGDTASYSGSDVSPGSSASSSKGASSLCSSDERPRRGRLDPDSVSDESGYHEDGQRRDELFYSDEELVIIEEQDLDEDTMKKPQRFQHQRAIEHELQDDGESRQVMAWRVLYALGLLLSAIDGTAFTQYYGVNLVPFGPDAGDMRVKDELLNAGQRIDLPLPFPFYGGLYNYTTISVNGYVSFGLVLDHGLGIDVGQMDTDWPKYPDAAMIGPYICKQQISNHLPGLKGGVFYRLLLRQSLFRNESDANAVFNGSSEFFQKSRLTACPETPNHYVRCNKRTDDQLDELMGWLQEGVAGAQMFRADAALVVTWFNTASAFATRSDVDVGQLSTYQMIWLTDMHARLSYVILNYNKLGFDVIDIRRNSRRGRCKALFNGGNHTGTVPVDPTAAYKNSPKSLAARSGVPHLARGRYMFRVDDVVRAGGCSNKTGGTFPMLIHPNIVSIFGETTVDVNAMCLDRAQDYILVTDQGENATCMVLNPSIARCSFANVSDWGMRTVYFYPRRGNPDYEGNFVGHIYFVPPTLDPQRLQIGNIYDWFKNPLPSDVMPISWYPRNFTNPDFNFRFDTGLGRISDEALYSVQLCLYVIGYKEFRDDEGKKRQPEHRIIARLGSYTNRNENDYRWRLQEERINLNQIEQWYMTDLERKNELFAYRIGYLKLAPIMNDDQQPPKQLPAGLVSHPIPLHWLWREDQQFLLFPGAEHEKARAEFVKQKAAEMCDSWYEEEAVQANFTADTEKKYEPCPCVERQAMADLGRFMPHPRCSKMFGDSTCTQPIGAGNCYISTQSYGSYAGLGNDENSKIAGQIAGESGQMCCYDVDGHLLQVNYQPTINGTSEVRHNSFPGLSTLNNDYMPNFLCCKLADFRCHKFFERRPSSECRGYREASYGEAIGAGVFNTIDNDKFVFNEPGVFTLLYIPKASTTPEVRIQARLERFPNRRVDFTQIGRRLGHADLVQPSKATVITGIAIEATDSARVHVLCRKDTRRFRYRTSVIVGNVMRYFDTMAILRFKGVLIYVNKTSQGQAEIYVVLERAQIGIRIRESFNMKFDRLRDFQESLGLLDIALSVPPQYVAKPDVENAREDGFQQTNLSKMAGLMRPFPNNTMGSQIHEDLQTEDVNSRQYWQHLIRNYRIPDSGEPGVGLDPYMAYSSVIPSENLFMPDSGVNWRFQVFPEATMMMHPIYRAADRFTSGNNRFHPISGTELLVILNQCRDMELYTNSRLQYQLRSLLHDYGISVCPDNSSEVVANCGDNWACLYNYVMLNSKSIGQASKEAWDSHIALRQPVVSQYCPRGWVHNNDTDACYYAQNQTPADPAVRYTQEQAESLCQTMGAHLVSIHDEDEDTFIRELIATNQNGMICDDWQVILGASCSNSTTLTWTDDSSFNFDLTNGTCSETYTMGNDTQYAADFESRWNPWDSTSAFTRFVCKKSANYI